MNNRILLSIAIACFLTAACNDNAGRKDGYSDKPLTKEDSLEKDVMDGHDVAMAKMNAIRRYLVQIKKEQDSLVKLPAKQQDAAYQQKLTGVEKDLTDALQGMNTWMEAYVVDSAKDNNELRIKYLAAEKEKVNTVKRQVLESVQRADSLLKKP